MQASADSLPNDAVRIAPNPWAGWHMPVLAESVKVVFSCCWQCVSSRLKWGYAGKKDKLAKYYPNRLLPPGRKLLGIIFDLTLDHHSTFITPNDKCGWLADGQHADCVDAIVLVTNHFLIDFEDDIASL